MTAPKARAADWTAALKGGAADWTEASEERARREVGGSKPPGGAKKTL